MPTLGWNFPLRAMENVYKMVNACWPTTNQHQLEARAMLEVVPRVTRKMTSKTSCSFSSRAYVIQFCVRKGCTISSAGNVQWHSTVANQQAPVTVPVAVVLWRFHRENQRMSWMLAGSGSCTLLGIASMQAKERTPTVRQPATSQKTQNAIRRRRLARQQTRGNDGGVGVIHARCAPRKHDERRGICEATRRRRRRPCGGSSTACGSGLIGVETRTEQDFHPHGPTL